MSVWFAGSAVAPALRAVWHLSGSQAAWLTSSVQLGFVVGTFGAAVLNLPDLLPSRWYFATAALLASIANALLLSVSGYSAALVTRFAVGLFLAGVYPPAMKMAATWFQAERGLAIGTVVGALTIGKAGPYLLDALGGAAVHNVVVSTSTAALFAATIVALWYRDGPFAFPKRPFSWQLVRTVLSIPRMRFVTGGYLGHMWELYSFWAWISAFMMASASAEASTGAPPVPLGTVKVLAFIAIAIGSVGCIWGGRASDRYGRARVVTWALMVSGSCALLVGVAFGRSLWLLVPIVLVWGVAVVADSAQFSAMVTESVPAHTVGTALTLQTSLGFLLTTVTIQMVPPVVDLIGWRWAFSMLAIGPALGIASIRGLHHLAASPSPPGTPRLSA